MRDQKRQLESLDTLLIALALLAPVAWQLLVLRHLARELPNADATAALRVGKSRSSRDAFWQNTARDAHHASRLTGTRSARWPFATER